MILPAAEATLKWSFDDADLPATMVGEVKTTADGPSEPAYPVFSGPNSAIQFAAPSYLRLDDESLEEQLRFDNGDEITVEAWVNVRTLGDNAYIIGKGRTASSGAKSQNQNWAFRLRKQKGQACVNFLFHSRDTDDAKGDWHRWTSNDGFDPDSGWHHVAVSYCFGKPDSIQAVIDGKVVMGKWDMGGKTTVPPVVDSDDVWVGSAMAGNRGNSFDGQIDELAVYREVVPAETLRERYRYVPQPIERPEVPAGKVLVQLAGPVAAHGEFPRTAPDVQLQWQQDQLAFTRLPHRYDDWAVRMDWTEKDKPTMVVRAMADITLPAGDYQWMIRSRGLSRLIVDDVKIASTAKMRNRTGAHHVVDPLPDVPVRGMRVAFMNDHQQIADFHSDGGIHQVTYEVLVGGPKYRVEFGETMVALAKLASDGTPEMFQLVASEQPVPVTDEGWQRFVKHENAMLDHMDTQARRSADAGQREAWRARHQLARERLIDGQQSDATIDSLVSQRIDFTNDQIQQRQASGGHLYTDQVAGILETHCGRCHGDKQQGELSLLSRESILRGGESGDPAVVPGEPDASLLMELVSADADDYRMPPQGPGLTQAEQAVVRQWIQEGAEMPAALPKKSIQVQPLVDDYAFLRRAYLDTVGVTPTTAEIQTFMQDNRDDRRQRLIERLLDDDRFADHGVGYWQDVLAENPNLLKPTLNNTGPFRFWIHEALRDNKPLDRFATELIVMRGSKWGGGAGGFSIASQNDVPMAAKAHVIGSAFLGVNLKCARCHDAPYHQWTQSDLFQMAAMLDRKPIQLPESSSVPAAFFDAQQRKPLIKVTLKPGTEIQPEWPLAQFEQSIADELISASVDSREALAAHVTGTRRFAAVMANRIWTRLMGRGLVELPDDWQGNPPSDPALLDHLTDELIRSGYDQKALIKTIMSSHAYQRQPATDATSQEYFAGPTRRRMTAEQIVDTSFHAVGRPLLSDQLTLDIEGTLPPETFLNFGFPRRAWEFTTLANERDRPSLALPAAAAVVDVLQAFGWRDSRPEPISGRDESANLIQPGVLANGAVGIWLTRLSDDRGLTDDMISAGSVDQLVDTLFLRLLTRMPTESERQQFATALQDGFDERVVAAPREESAADEQLPFVSWSNHLNTQANVIKIQMQERVRKGPPATGRLESQWRQRAEDVVWALINSPEFIMVP
ncbi:Planctomycete cytochrome C [Stieleria varia]|uniref:Planctomycete cytochrome C n=2 Tax=Stieleria varia TaxID=2528005 RepID=A0A5C6B6A9_9BACT|nr:Planctomycete cytochrome C [Stieleria varia]